MVPDIEKTNPDQKPQNKYYNNTLSGGTQSRQNTLTNNSNQTPSNIPPIIRNGFCMAVQKISASAPASLASEWGLSGKQGC